MGLWPGFWAHPGGVLGLVPRLHHEFPVMISAQLEPLLVPRRLITLDPSSVPLIGTFVTMCHLCFPEMLGVIDVLWADDPDGSPWGEQAPGDSSPQLAAPEQVASFADSSEETLFFLQRLC